VGKGKRREWEGEEGGERRKREDPNV